MVTRAGNAHYGSYVSVPLPAGHFPTVHSIRTTRQDLRFAKSCTERPAAFSTHLGAMAPDYTISTKQLFVRTARLMFDCYKNLQFQAHVENIHVRKITDLSFWVLDYTVRLQPMPFHAITIPKPDMWYTASKVSSNIKTPATSYLIGSWSLDAACLA